MKTKLLLIILVLTGAFSFAQTKVADKFFENYAYIKASELYEDAVKNGDDSAHVLTRLGDCYYNNSNSEKAAIWYKKALEMHADDVSAEHLYKYIQTQRSLGNYEEAENWLDTFKALQSSDGRVASEMMDLGMYDELSSMEKVYIDVVNLDLNTEYSDFGGYEHDGRMFFASTRGSDNGSKVYTWNEQPFLDIFEASVKETNGVKEFGSVMTINVPEVNSNFHESTVAISSDGKTIYFTRDNLKKNKKRLDSDRKGTTHLKLYKASLDNGTWKDIEELPFNSDNFSIGHPALSPDDKQLYFVSDRYPKDFSIPEEKRDNETTDTDIYVVDILDEGNNYGEPRNLGASINTEGREMFPFIAKDSTMYFSSDGFVNLGLLDIYKSNLIKDFGAKPENLGAPFNSGYDDFAYYVNPETESGYFSSNRPGGKGNDDIYTFSAYECKQVVKGIVRDKESNEPLADAKVELIDASGKIVGEVTTNASGEYTFEVECEKNYSVRGSKPDYDDDVQSFTTTAINDYEHTVDLYLECPLCGVPCEIVINPIFFDFDKWNIRTDSKVDLELIVDIMRNHPEMKITIESHTDRRGTLRYNDKLSDRRAKSTRDYIISRGIDAERIVSAIGYGERRKLISDEEINNMSTRAEKEAAHQKNRRSHFRIVDCDEEENK